MSGVGAVGGIVRSEMASYNAGLAFGGVKSKTPAGETPAGVFRVACRFGTMAAEIV